MFAQKFGFISILLIMALTFPRRSFNMSLEEKTSNIKPLPLIVKILNAIESKLNNGEHDMRVNQLAMGMILKRILELAREVEREEESDYWLLRQGR